jgi:hypothetical protein
MALSDVLREGEEPGGDVLVEGLRWLLQELMDAEVGAQPRRWSSRRAQQ